MDKARHGRLMREAMSSRRVSRKALADLIKKTPRTITNYTSGETMPSLAERELMRSLLGPYDVDGDPVEIAVRRSGLVKWRQDAVVSEYERHVYDQRREETG